MSALTFEPIRQEIESISQTNPGVVTTVDDHGYADGLYIRIVLPGNFGMPEVNENVYEIRVLTDDTFAIDVDTRSFEPFVIGTTLQSPQVIPVGEISSTLANSEKNNLTPVGG